MPRYLDPNPVPVEVSHNGDGFIERFVRMRVNIPIPAWIRPGINCDPVSTTTEVFNDRPATTEALGTVCPIDLRRWRVGHADDVFAPDVAFESDARTLGLTFCSITFRYKCWSWTKLIDTIEARRRFDAPHSPVVNPTPLWAEPSPRTPGSELSVKSSVT